MDIIVNFALLNVWGWIALVATGLGLFYAIPVAIFPRKAIEPVSSTGVGFVAGLIGLIFVGIFQLPALLAIQWPLNGWGWAYVLYLVIVFIWAFGYTLTGRDARPRREGWDAALAVLIVLVRTAATLTVFLFATGVFS